jgi:Fe-S-cluster containining protein
MNDVRKLQEEIIDDFSKNKTKPLSKKSKIRFQCQQSGQCCHHNEVMLNPYDIMEMAKFLNMSSLAFAMEYVSIHIGSGSHLPIAMFKQIQDGECAFLKNRKCSIHPAKPKICRAFPLAAITEFDPKNGKAKSGYVQTRRISCPGTRANKTITFEQFRKYADLKRYDKGSRSFIEGVHDLCTNFRTKDLTERDYDLIIPFLYFPDSILKKKDDNIQADSAEWSKIGMECVKEYMKARQLQK